MKNSITILLFTLGILLLSCSENKSQITDQQITDVMQKYIIDKRLEYFDVAIKIDDDQGFFDGYTVSETAYQDLKELATTNNIEFNVELLPDEAFKENPWGIVTLSVCNIRAKKRHSAELVTQSLLGTPVKIYKKIGGWYLIQTPDRYFGWVDGAGIEPKSNAEMKEWKSYPKTIFAKMSGSAFEAPNSENRIVSDLVLGDLLTVTDESGDYFKILFPDGREAFVKKADCVSTEQWYSKTFTIEDLLSTAFQFKGVPYLWGGTSPKMVDCSGFTKTVYFYHGLILQRDASQQTLYGEEIDVKNGYEKLEPGDLVFFGRKADADKAERVTHVGMCIGDQKFIHASGKVRINSLDAASSDYTEHYEKGFVRARRIVDNVDGDGIEWIVDNDFYRVVLPDINN